MRTGDGVPLWRHFFSLSARTGKVWALENLEDEYNRELEAERKKRILEAKNLQFNE